MITMRYTVCITQHAENSCVASMTYVYLYYSYTQVYIGYKRAEHYESLPQSREHIHFSFNNEFCLWQNDRRCFNTMMFSHVCCMWYHNCKYLAMYLISLSLSLYICISLYIYMYLKSMHVCMYLRLPIYICIDIYIYMCVIALYICICIYNSVSTYICDMCIYIYIYTFTWLFFPVRALLSS